MSFYNRLSFVILVLITIGTVICIKAYYIGGISGLRTSMSIWLVILIVVMFTNMFWQKYVKQTNQQSRTKGNGESLNAKASIFGGKYDRSIAWTILGLGTVFVGYTFGILIGTIATVTVTVIVIMVFHRRSVLRQKKTQGPAAK